MNIETANRLYELRKKNNLSQEELADKLGISRQAVSKWERAEASPDTDNLILLAKLYGVSLDDLLNMETASIYEDENPNTEEKEDTNQNEAHEDYVNISNDGVHVHSEDGESVIIGKKGITIIDKGGDEKFKTYRECHRPKHPIEDVFQASAPILIIAAYLILGFLLPNGWVCYWPLFILIPVFETLPEAIRKRRFCVFAYPCLVAAAYCFIGMRFEMWHPYWILFLSIPVYYVVFGAIDKAVHHGVEEYEEDND